MGMAAYAAGLNKARKKQQKAMLDMWLDEQKEATRQRKTVGNRYRNAMAGGGRVTGSQRPVIGTSDPLAEADGEDAVRIRSQRRANARARRLGRAAPYPDAEVRPIPGKTQGEIKREWELEDQKRKWKWQEDREADKREQETEDQVRDRTFKGLEGSFNQLNDWMFGVDRNALNDTGAKAYNDLMTYIAEGWKKVQSGESQQTDFYSAAIEAVNRRSLGCPRRIAHAFGLLARSWIEVGRGM